MLFKSSQLNFNVVQNFYLQHFTSNILWTGGRYFEFDRKKMWKLFCSIDDARGSVSLDLSRRKGHCYWYILKGEQFLTEKRRERRRVEFQQFHSSNFGQAASSFFELNLHMFCFYSKKKVSSKKRTIELQLNLFIPNF